MDVVAFYRVFVALCCQIPKIAFPRVSPYLLMELLRPAHPLEHSVKKLVKFVNAQNNITYHQFLVYTVNDMPIK